MISLDKVTLNNELAMINELTLNIIANFRNLIFVSPILYFRKW